jgi:hypothetical protein
MYELVSFMQIRAALSGAFAHIAFVAPSHRPARDAATLTAQCRQGFAPFEAHAEAC